MRLFPCTSNTVFVSGALIAAVACAALPVKAQRGVAPNSAQGSITVDNRKTEFRHANAVVQPSRINGKPETILIVTDKPLTLAMATDCDLRKKAREEEAVKMLEVSVDKRPDEVTSILIWVAPVQTTSSTRRHKVELDTSDAKVIRGRVYMEEPWEAFGNRYLIDVRFDAAVAKGK